MTETATSNLSANFTAICENPGIYIAGKMDLLKVMQEACDFLKVCIGGDGKGCGLIRWRMQDVPEHPQA